jgi:peroxiredoxin
MPLISPGQLAPDFELVTDSYEKFRLSEHLGKAVVLYFYPQDDTEGCTLENIEFTDLMPEFRKLAAVVVGISPDTVEKHCSFRDKYNLGVTLAADPRAQGDRSLRYLAAQEAVGRRVHGREARSPCWSDPTERSRAPFSRRASRAMRKRCWTPCARSPPAAAVKSRKRA